MRREVRTVIFACVHNAGRSPLRTSWVQMATCRSAGENLRTVAAASPHVVGADRDVPRRDRQPKRQNSCAPVTAADAGVAAETAP